jgi:hypothetical protein
VLPLAELAPWFGILFLAYVAAAAICFFGLARGPPLDCIALRGTSG